MTDLREAAQMALDALDSDNPDIQLRAATALRAALAQPEPEPVACDCDVKTWCAMYKKCNRKMLGLEPFVAPPQREWQRLTGEDVADIRNQWEDMDYKLSELCRAIEAKLKEKNT